MFLVRSGRSYGYNIEVLGLEEGSFESCRWRLLKIRELCVLEGTMKVSI